MYTIALDSSFKKTFSKRIKGNKSLEKKFWEKVKIFVKDPYDRRLKTHKLSGKLKDLWSITVEHDCRIIFYFEGKNKAIFVDIGKHEEVY